MLKASSSEQVENKTNETLQRVEFDVTSYVPVSSTSKKSSILEVTPRIEEDVVSVDVLHDEEDENEYIATRRLKRVIKKSG